MATQFRSSHIANKLGITTHTIRRWVGRFPSFFSPDAQATSRYKSSYTVDDFKILATIHYLSSAGYGLDRIEQKLLEGYRHEEDLELPIPDGDHEQDQVALLETYLKQTRLERDLARESLQYAQQRIVELTNQLVEAQYRLGITEGELNLLHRQRQSKEANQDKLPI